MRIHVSSLQEQSVIPASSVGSQEGAQASRKLTTELFRDSPSEELMVSSELSYLKAIHQPRVVLLSFLKNIFMYIWVFFLHVYACTACCTACALAVFGGLEREHWML